MPSPLEPGPGAAQPKPMCEKLWTLPYIRRQMRFDPSPLLVAQPKQVPAHNPDPLPKTNQDRIVRAKKLMSSDPSSLSNLNRDRRPHFLLEAEFMGKTNPLGYGA